MAQKTVSADALAFTPLSMTNKMTDSVVEQITGLFPVETDNARLEVKNVRLVGDTNPYNLDRLQTLRRSGGTLQLPIKADIVSVNKKTGDRAVKKNHVIGHLPITTPHYSYLVGGTEYQMSFMPRLKSGIYPDQRQNGEFFVDVNLIEGKKFEMYKHPAKNHVLMKFRDRGGAINIYPILRLLGMSHDQIAEKLGPTIANESRSVDGPAQVRKFAKAVTGRMPQNLDDAKAAIFDYMAGTKVREDTTKDILGTAYSRITPEALLDAGQKLTELHKGTLKPTSRSTLEYRELFTGGDVLADKIRRSKTAIHRSVRDNLERHAGDVQKINKILPPKLLDRPIHAFFTQTASANAADQTNPLDMYGNATLYSPMGEGGVSDPNAIRDDVKETGYTQFGILDPMHSPESEKAGVNLHIANGAAVVDKEFRAKLYDPKKKQYVAVPAYKFRDLNIAFPDEFRVVDGKVQPVNKEVRAFGKQGDMSKIPAKDVDYILPSPSMLFGENTNIVPFLQNNQGNRVGMAVRHMSQAVSLKNPEQPLVQVAKAEQSTSMERNFGRAFSFQSPSDGIVESVDADAITIKDKAGKSHRISIYDHYPLNETRAFLHTKPLVAVGTPVKQGQTIADTNFTKDGVLSIGTNLRAAYLPYMGLTFEDAVVVSESAAQKLTSEHLYETKMETGGEDIRINPEAYRQFVRVPKDQMDKLDERGIVKPGEVLNTGDLMVAALKKRQWDKTMEDLSKIRASFAKGLEWKDGGLKWEGLSPGVVIRVDRDGETYKILVKTEEAAVPGDKISGRHGNKGTISRILPDGEMPKDKDGNPVDILMNPMGVPGRINPGQILEVATAKVAEKTGAPITVRNFATDKNEIHVPGHYRTVRTGPGGRETKKVWIEPYSYFRDYTEATKELLEANNLSEKEELFDGKTGQTIGEVTVGPQYILKLTHQVNKKFAARGIGGHYDINKIPKGGGHHGAQAFGELGNYVMLAHGATSNLKEAQTIKSDMEQHDYWYALQKGEIVPPPKTSYAYNKFIGYLNAVGVNVERVGDNLVVAPLTDKGVLEMSQGEIDPTISVLKYPFKEKTGGLFDPKKTGGLDGTGWTHIKLANRMPNPIFEKAITQLLGITGSQYKGLTGYMDGYTYYPPSLGIDDTGNIVPKAAATTIGFGAIDKLLGSIDVEKELASTKTELANAPVSSVDRLNRKLRYLNMLSKNGLKPSEVYMQSVVPVLPPSFRRVNQLPNGGLRFDGINNLYRDVGFLNNTLKEGEDRLTPESAMRTNVELYGALKALSGVGQLSDPKSKGILEILKGPSPGEGYIHQKLLKRKQDLTMRSVIIPEPSLSLDQVGIPEEGAYQIYEPFLIKRLVGIGMKPLEAKEHIKKRTDSARRALDLEMSERPLMMKRDPALHKYSIQAFNPVIVGGTSIKIHPLVCEGYNADFDGDMMSVYVPVSAEAVEEAKTMLPSRNLFHPATHKIMFAPSLEQRLGLYLISQIGEDKGRKFSTIQSAKKAFEGEDVSANEVLDVNGKKTTGGRILLADTLGLKGEDRDKILYDQKFLFDKKAQADMLSAVGKKSPGKFGRVGDALRKIGDQYVYRAGWTLTLDDLTVPKDLRNSIMLKADADAKKIRSGKLSKEAADKKVIEVYKKADAELEAALVDSLYKGKNRLAMMHKAGVKPQWAQLKQLVGSPGMFQNAKEEIIPTGVTHSYSEGLPTGEYATAAHGVRRGLIEKVISVRTPGYLSKQATNSMLDVVVVDDDCKTKDFDLMSMNSPDALNRYTAETVEYKGSKIPSGSLITPEVMSLAKQSGKQRVKVRSPIGCNSKIGICQKCFGAQADGNPIKKGTHIGILAGQAVGEPTTQMSMRVFHTGGVLERKETVMDAFDKVKNLLLMQVPSQKSAVISPVTGMVTAIRQNPDTKEWSVFVGDQKVKVPATKKVIINKGVELKAGQPITEGEIDPKQLLEATDIMTTRKHIASRLDELLKGGARKNMIDVVARSLTDTAIVEDPAGYKDMARGDKVRISSIEAYNREAAQKGKPLVKYQPTLIGFSMLPLKKGGDWLTMLNYNHLRQSIVEAAQTGASSDLHGLSPIPGMIYGPELGKKREGSKSPY